MSLVKLTILENSLKQSQIRFLVSSTLIVATTAFLSICYAQNPVIQTKYTADPAPMVYNDTVFLYTSHDEDDAFGFKMLNWMLYPSSVMAFGLNPKLLSVSTKEPILPIFWQDNYFPLLPGEKRTIKMQVDASLITGDKLLFKLDGGNIRAAQEQNGQYLKLILS
jgi:hypothetical protein